MPQIELTCAKCGEKFTAEADYIIPGIKGRLSLSGGKVATFIDPTADYHCPNCIEDMLEEAMKNTNKEGANSDENRNPED